MPGLTVAETAGACLGIALTVRFLLQTACPAAARGLNRASSRYSANLREEFIHWPSARIAIGLFASGILCAGILFVATGSASVSLASGTVPMSLAGTIIRWYRRRRRIRVLSQLPALLDLLAGHMKAGHSLPSALAETVPLLPAGLREEMQWVLQKSRLGTHLTVALREWEERIPAEEISLIVRPLRAALPGGGNVVELLERTRDILMRRHRTHRKLRSMTAQARLQAAVLTLLPPLFLGALSLIDPGFVSSLIGTPQGRTVLAAAGLLQLCGWLTIRRILGVRV